MNSEYEVRFDEYDFNHETGKFNYVLKYKRMAKTGSMTLFMEREDGAKHMASVYPDRDFLGMNNVPTGSKLIVEYVRSVNGSVYIKSIVSNR